MKSKVFGLFMALMLLLSGNGFAQSLPLLLTDDSFWNGNFDNFYYSDGSSSLEACDPNNPVNGCVKEAKQSTGSFLADGDVEIRKLVQPTAETGVFDVSIGVRGKEVVPNEPICAVVVFDRSSTMAGGKFINARIGAVELLNLLHSQNPENYLGFVSFHLSADAEIQLEKRSAELAFSTGEIRDWSSNDEGTNIHWGLVEARNQLMGQEGCDDLRKFVILISDGEPNSYHTLSGDECYTNNGTGAGWGGSDYPVCIDLISGDPFAAKYATGAAALLKANNYSTIYSIGYGAETKGKAILREIASDSSYYRDGNSSSIIQIFNSIAGDITSDKVEVGTNAQIVDTLNQVTLKSGNNTKTFAKITEGWQTFNFQVSLNPLVGADWYKTNNGLTLSYTDAYDQHQTLTIAPNKTAEIYWEVPVESVTVTFDPNGGTPTTPVELEVESGGTVEPDDVPTNIVNPGHELTGWTVCGDDELLDFPLVVNSNVDLCAVWEVNKYTVDIDVTPSGYGTVSSGKVIANYGATIAPNANGTLTIGGVTVTATPTPDTPEWDYSFSGWNNTCGNTLTNDCTITAQFKREKKEYLITFKDEDGTELKSGMLGYGETPEAPSNPTKPGDAEHTYTFTGWSPAVHAVNGAQVYTAQYTSEVNNYTINIVSNNINSGTVSPSSITVQYGTPVGTLGTNTTITVGGKQITATPKTDTAQWNYEFDNWTHNCGAIVTTGCTITANFSSTLRKYAITFVDEDGTTVLKEATEYDYGTPAANIIKPADPTKPSTAQYNYRFAGWSPTVSDVTGTVTYKATYELVGVNQYTITFYDEDGQTILDTQAVDYGGNVTYGGEQPTKPSTAQYSYAFDNWYTDTQGGNIDDLTNVIANRNVYARYNPTLRKYTVTWKNSDGSVLKTDENVPYGTTPTYDGQTPTSGGNAQYSYAFSGWTPAISPVYGDVTYTAQYTETTNKYTVTWKNRDGTVLETDADVPYGTTPTYDGQTPIRPDTTKTGYTFNGWTPVIEPVKGDTVYTAQFAETKKKGGSSGGGGSTSYACKNLPSNVEINNSLKPSGKDVDYYYSTDESKPCTFQCKVGYVRNEKTEKCEVPEKDKPKDPDPVPPKKCSIEGSTHSAEVNEAYIWACERGIIKSDTIQGARLGEFLNRAEMAKITTIFEMLEVGTMPDRTKDCSAFEASMSGYNSEMKNYMVTSCQLLRMGIHTADYTPIPDFMPRKFVSRAEFGTILSRILWGDKYEAEKNSRYYYVDHLYKLRDEGILTNIDPTLVERRSYAILMIYRAAKMLGKI